MSAVEARGGKRREAWEQGRAVQCRAGRQRQVLALALESRACFWVALIGPAQLSPCPVMPIHTAAATTHTPITPALNSQVLPLRSGPAVMISWGRLVLALVLTLALALVPAAEPLPPCSSPATGTAAAASASHWRCCWRRSGGVKRASQSLRKHARRCASHLHPAQCMPAVWG